jgi:hypothetical protein
VFYNVFKLDEDFWHLKLFSLKEELKVNTLLLIAVIMKTLINGNKSLAPLFEEGMRLLADKVRPINHKPADFLLEAKFVDDFNDSLANIFDAKAIKKAVDGVFTEFGAEISVDGVVEVAGMVWHPKTNYIEIKILQLHFGKLFYPRTQLFKDGSSATENFVPRRLTKRMVMSKFMSIFDLRGLLIAKIAI